LSMSIYLSTLILFFDDSSVVLPMQSIYFLPQKEGNKMRCLNKE
jgi:hypothetical protein